MAPISLLMPEAFHLLFCRSAGTSYESFAHDMVEQATDRMMCFLQDCSAQGYSVREVQRDEMHMLVSAYCAALIPPIEHGYNKLVLLFTVNALVGTSGKSTIVRLVASLWDVDSAAHLHRPGHYEGRSNYCQERDTANVDHEKELVEAIGELTHDELVGQDGIYRRFVVERRQAAGWKVGA